ncbi:uncharacterized protein LOC110346088 isoform X2 [Heterocephalus glaber]|uniref:Uncharacterized protein LOC110346088 isoform X2 n=1 Tax=Heterocephalus glaber TaxID=10181 RepID=A0AAX6RY67_HETGA|nr:uncharacterized protein LOC110346088 isoform X2 [Heterocephalus glaber]
MPACCRILAFRAAVCLLSLLCTRAVPGPTDEPPGHGTGGLPDSATWMSMESQPWTPKRRDVEWSEMQCGFPAESPVSLARLCPE